MELTLEEFTERYIQPAIAAYVEQQTKGFIYDPEIERDSNQP